MKHDFFTIKGFNQSAYAELTNPDGRLKVELPTGSSGLTDTELRASAVPVAQVSGASWSTSVTIVSGTISSTVATGVTPADAVDDGSAPVKVGGIARTANPAVVAGGDMVSFSADAIGRQLIRPLQARGLLATGYATLTTGTETTLYVSPAATYSDLIYVMGANTSDAAATVDIRSGTGLGVLATIQIPANGTAGVAFPVPLPQEETVATWTADMNDITGTSVYISALFSKEV